MEVKMGKLLAKRDWTSQGRFVEQTNEFVNPIREVLSYGTSTWGEIATSD